MQKCEQKNSVRNLSRFGRLSLWAMWMVTGESASHRDGAKENSTLFANKYPILPIDSLHKKNTENSSNTIFDQNTQSLHMLGFKNSLIADAKR